MTVTIRRVVTPDELDEVYSFRYAVYVEEMSRVESYACHKSKRVMDSLDNLGACVFAAWSKGEIVGTVRVNLAKGGGVGDYLFYYQLGHLDSAELDCVAISTRLMVHRQYRGSTLALRLAAACFVFGSDNGVRNYYIDCDIDNIPFFHRLGYVPHLNRFEHPEFGLGAVMRFDVQNLEHLIRIKSPFYRLIEDERSRVDIGEDHA